MSSVTTWNRVFAPVCDAPLTDDRCKPTPMRSALGTPALLALAEPAPAAVAQDLGSLWYPRGVHGLNVGYGVFNVTLTLGWLVRLYRGRDESYHRFRRTCLLAHVSAQPLSSYCRLRRPVRSRASSTRCPR